MTKEQREEKRRQEIQAYLDAMTDEERAEFERTREKIRQYVLENYTGDEAII